MKTFEHYLRKGIVRKQSPDPKRAEFAKEEAKNDFNALLLIVDKLGITRQLSNLIVKNCYDMLMGLIRSKLLLKGYHSYGSGAHEAEVSYLRIIGFGENDVVYVDGLRYYRNRILYYGEQTGTSYATEVFKFTKRFYKELLN